ncbi:hypothetical protein IW261DRAFT_1293956, partial [Armillaria novae-zelandiae]
VILPMPEVPCDILGEIFGHVVSDSNSDPYALIKTASVCSSWRSVAFTHPRLW